MTPSTQKTVILLLGVTLTFFGFSSLLAAQQEGPIIEVRVYKVTEGKMDEWERYFHEKLVEPQEEAGIKLLNAYRTLKDENLFVWSRQFSGKTNMAKERAAFYESDQWQKVLLPELKRRALMGGIGQVHRWTSA